VDRIARPAVARFRRLFGPGKIPSLFIDSDFSIGVLEAKYFLGRTLAEPRPLLYPPCWNMIMKRISHFTHTPTYANAAHAVAAPSRRLPVEDGSRPGNVEALAKRCVR
jgi:hypothetical protein